MKRKTFKYGDSVVVRGYCIRTKGPRYGYIYSSHEEGTGPNRLVYVQFDGGCDVAVPVRYVQLDPSQAPV